MRKLIAALLALVLTLSLAGCMAQEPVETEPTEPVYMDPPAPVKKTIHVLLPVATEGWEGAMAAQAKTTVDTLVAEGNFEIVTHDYESQEQQTELLAQIAADSDKSGNTGVVTMPVGKDMDQVFADLTQANVAYALAGNIPEATAAASVANAAYDQHMIGAAAAAFLVASGMKEGDSVLIIAGLSDDEALRTEGFKLYLQGKLEYDGAAIENSWSSLSSLVYSDMQGQTRESADAYFATYMDSSKHASTRYVCTWNDEYALGVIDALEGEEIKSDIRKKFLDTEPIITGFGGSKDMCDVLTGTTAVPSVESLGGLCTMVNDTTLLQQALTAMAEYFGGTVVKQDQTQPITWLDATSAANHTPYA